ncbi:hypothetical protein G7Z17_g4286 [Cylindrodendrum hubeiense]|uniref:Uncharacterized protein n=1 Tax=Cylindrodendrum hubeiense TaxID=595255 RepID=A0A9P5H958_9HYPO|nr:hypothetical protein G7Z17_g4286 [Cylindrodendrum hubeiense]
MARHGMSDEDVTENTHGLIAMPAEMTDMIIRAAIQPRIISMYLGLGLRQNFDVVRSLRLVNKQLDEAVRDMFWFCFDSANFPSSIHSIRPFPPPVEIWVDPYNDTIALVKGELPLMSKSMRDNPRLARSMIQHY